jgi:hypothetical protein
MVRVFANVSSTGMLTMLFLSKVEGATLPVCEIYDFCRDVKVVCQNTSREHGQDGEDKAVHGATCNRLVLRGIGESNS